ncbi:DNA polymerase III, beta chain [Acidipropionibacterium acidipropionici ATCC 4875]|uniref:Beta sliding clamp n=1 Tax=Acidipropionibacterium acidipropionici (strain ATCC 4875 / DSM 20272 / JCM 6432 / NBRC 12425 / NCIMB 8070 / 4) TaxID=1171373 RepID=K7RSN6_ACIA4|nr:DNA polymerase III subunit beta [Acidipropionibacterium acidipropionici]AFV87858.1 DNA polymerase III, beta chain [Acidipropionibacterium acidipropionici ATCC 4875]ALN16728.1 DNA polymerase III subunit beta [Acidipropionibacterium acidipropionici]APZ10907.1 DNA polymerase III subunit beta [Acidipropionibacterium acidipropionici]
MKIRLERDVMADAVAWVARTLPNRPAVPILAGLLVRAEGSTVVLSGSDNETTGQITLPAQVDEEGESLVSGKLLADIARSLPAKPVEITADPARMELVCGSARFTLQGLPVEEYPAMPEMPAATGTVAAEIFARAVAQVVVAAGRDELLPVFTGVRVEIEGDTLSLLATDRYRMALKEITWNPAATDLEATALVPAKVLNETARSMTSGEEVTVNLSSGASGDGLVGFEGTGSSGSRRMTTRLLDGEFPKVRHLMDIKATRSVRVRTDELMAAVRRVALVAERNTSLRMSINEDDIALSAATGDQAQASEAIQATVVDHVDGDPTITAAGFNPHYLTDALGALDTPYVDFAFTAPGKPCLVTGVNDLEGESETDYKHVIMLMRLPS